jgi:peroxiredoxin
MMKNTFRKVISVVIIIFFSTTISVKAQEGVKSQPAKMCIVNGEEISEAKVQELANNNRIKEMRKGVSDEEKTQLVKKYGNRVNDSFIAVFTLYSEQEMAEKAKVPKAEAEAQQKAAIAESAKREKESTVIHVDDLAADFTVEMLDGKKIKLSDLKGKVVLLNFWATWCGPCMMEFFEIPDQIIKRFKGKDFVFLPISRGEKREVVMSKMLSLKSKGIDFPVGLDPNKIIYSQYAKEFIPRNFVIDRNGKVTYTTIGFTKDGLEELAGKIEELLK